jgi:hypothetical protein
MLSTEQVWPQQHAFATPAICRTTVWRAGNLYVLTMLWSDGSNRVVETISELRARRALFHHPVAYQKAFGEPPDWKTLRLSVLMKEKVKGLDL